MHWQAATTTILNTLVQQPRLGLITDIDGTISPIVAVPDAAFVTPRNLELLQALQPHLALTAVISGRTVTDTQKMVNLPGLVYIGNHGIEWWSNGQATIAPEVISYRPTLEAALKDIEPHLLPGMLLEDKGVTLSVHYRLTEQPDSVEDSFAPILQYIATQHGLSLFLGRRVFELRPPVQVNKGSALYTLVTQHHLDGAIYLGDDTTDVDALRMARRLREELTCYALGVGVESEHMPAALRETADLLVSGVQDVEAFLTWLLKARIASST